MAGLIMAIPIVVLMCPYVEAFTDCTHLNSTWPLNVVNTVTTDNLTAQFSCSDQYIIDGPSTAMCQEDGRWSRDPPTCIYMVFLPITINRYSSPIWMTDGPGMNYGRVEMNVNWTETFTLCQSGFDENVAKVICTYLGYSALEGFEINSFFGPSSHRPLPAYFVCNGNESSPTDCQIKGYDNLSCDNNTEVSIKCRPGVTELSSPYGYSDEGEIEIFHYGGWNYMQVFDVREVCQMLGFGYTGLYAIYVGSSKIINHYLTGGRFTCDAEDTTLLECDLRGSINLDRSTEYFSVLDGVICFDDRVANIRLTQGRTPYSGFLEVEMGGRWRAPCTARGVYSLIYSVCRSTDMELGLVSYTHGQAATEGWAVWIYCSSSYPGPLSCRANTDRRCQIRHDSNVTSTLVNCNKLVKVDGINTPVNGQVNYTTYYYGGIVAEIYCNNGYVLNGSRFITYTTGTWAGNVPTCERVECPTLEPVENGRWYGHSGAYTYDCNTGYKPATSIGLYCRFDGSWSGGPARCVKDGSGLPILTTPVDSYNRFDIHDAECFEIQTSQSIPIFEKRHHKIYICSNGIVTFDAPYSNPLPERDPTSYGNRTILSAFFTDIDSRIGYIEYSVIDIFEDQTMLELNPAFNSLIDVDDFSPTIVLTVRWVYRWCCGNDNPAYLQPFALTLISDGKDTFVAYKYFSYPFTTRKDDMTSPDIWIGYYDGEKHYETFSHSFTEVVLNPHTNIATEEYVGLLIYRLTSPLEPSPVDKATDCKKWYISQQLNNVQFSDQLPECPCTIARLQTDPWFDPLPKMIGSATCFNILPLEMFLPSGKTCCYNTSTSKWTAEMPYAGGFQLYHPTVYPRQNKLHDISPKELCCSKIRTCGLYYKFRPTGSCRSEPTFSFATLWGDPHFQTLDGRTFTFNGLGEYILLNISDGITTFELQARTAHARRPDGTSINATVFEAFAGRDNNGAAFHVELTRGRNDSILYVNGADISLEYKRHSKMSPFMYVPDKGNITVVRQEDTMRVTFTSCGVSLNISHEVGMLAVNIMIPEQYNGQSRGLLGNFDKDQTNDFQAPDGTIFANNMTEREIFAYGNKWEVTRPVFVYPENLGHADFHFANFTPPFLDEADPLKVEEALKKNNCGGISDIPCVFDYVFTGNAEVAANTKRIEDTAREVTENLGRVVPSARPCGTQNVTIGEIVTCAIDVDFSGNVTMQLVDNDVEAVFDETSGLLTYNQSTDSPPNLRLVATSDSGMDSPDIFVDVLFCSGCSGHGRCNGEPRDDERETYHFRYSTCVCDTGYDGTDCERDFDGCASKPCSQNRACVDLSPENESHMNKSFSCGDCMEGYTKITEQKCQDIDECQPGGDARCSHICRNKPGGYTCSCFPGYRVDPRDKNLCQDVDECSEGNHNCSQVCENTKGSFRCKCYKGYRSDPKEDCVLVLDACKDNQLNCSKTAGCRVTRDKTEECFCQSGFRLASNGTSCEDVDECQLGFCTQRCTNSFGAYKCSCHDGFELIERNKCRPCPYPTWGPNCTNTCNCSEKGASHCHHIKGCKCRHGWKGNMCNIDVDECKNDVCHDATKRCVNLQGSYDCVCKDGFHNNGTGSCTDIDECKDITLHQCEQVCVDGFGGYSCACHLGFTLLNSTHCQDIDECNQGISKCEHLCENFPGRFNCYCRYGYYLREDRRTCEKVLNPCLTYANISCSHYCVIENEQAFCKCNIGYTLKADNQTCVDVDECSIDGSNHCSSGSVCKNIPGSYMCECPIGSQLQNDGRTCSDCDQFHYGLNCSLRCECLKGKCDKQLGCICDDGWTGHQCHIDINECETNPNLCPGLLHVCQNTLGGFECRCKSGFVMMDGQCVDVDECSDLELNDCDHGCNNTNGSFKCLCHNGFTWNGTHCRDINECLGLHQCEQTCKNSEGTYDCVCEDGFSLNLEDRRTCQPTNPCSDLSMAECEKRNAQCVVKDHIVVCTCAKGYQMEEDRCTDINECSQSPAPCSHICDELPGTFRCTCPSGFYLDELNTTCIGCTGWTFGDNCEQHCECNRSNTKSCDPSRGDCSCHVGWKGDNCTVDVNECSELPGADCPRNSVCNNTPGSYSCKCETGYIKTADGQCQECPRYRFGEDCSLTCSCNPANTDTCHHVTGSCVCKTGHSGRCDKDVDECGNGDLCAAYENCVNTVGSYLCVCKDEYLQEDNKCQDPCHDCQADCINNTCVLDEQSLMQQVILYGTAGGGGLLVVVVIVTTIVCLRRRTNRRKQRRQHGRQNRGQGIQHPLQRKDKQRTFDNIS